MPLTFKVPAAVKGVAEHALRLHRESPIDGVGGIGIAEMLTSCEQIEAPVVARMRRFFTVNERHYQAELALAYRPTNSPLMRSWDLYGGQAGKTWSDATYAEAVRNGFVEEDQWVALLRLAPEQVYERFGMGAWRWEYDLTPAKAARFTEEYHRATGLNLDVARAYGSGRHAVTEAMMRRIRNADPFALLARTILRKEYRQASEMDMADVKRSIGRPALSWPGLIGFAVLGAREPALTRALVEGTPAPPPLGTRPLPSMAYSEPIAWYTTYLHPRGVRWSPNAPAGLMVEAGNLFERLYAGKPVDEEHARDVLRKARRFTGAHGLAANVGHVLLEAWKRREWDLFMEALPLDSLVRAPFERHVSARTRL